MILTFIMKPSRRPRAANSAAQGGEVWEAAGRWPTRGGQSGTGGRLGKNYERKQLPTTKHKSRASHSKMPDVDE